LIIEGPQAVHSQRQQLLDTLDDQLARCADKGERAALLVLNIHKFREINISYGHGVGDIVLAEIRERIAAVLRAGDSVFRIGNDEFAVLLNELRTAQVVQLAVAKILAAVSRDYQVNGMVLAVTAVAGVAVFPDHAGTRHDILVAADSALYHAREQQLEYSVYDAGMRARDVRFAHLKANLRNAIDGADLLLHYQPQIDLQQGAVSGTEALARWNHAELGWIRPDVFIHVAEKTGLIDTLTYWSLNAALREWLQFCRPCGSVSIAVNLSAKLLHSPEVVDLVDRALNIWGAQPESLVLEVTESAMMADPEVALRTLSALHERGITLSIDDFGTGYSSLAYLKKLPVSELKIDRSFVMQMADSKQDRMIVQSIIDLAHNLEMSVVAEGIENQQILDMLVRMGCDYGQGYHIARPMPPHELPDWAAGSAWQTPQRALV